MPISKPFAVATEGPTVDGRNIDRKWIEDMAKYYDQKVYTAVINLEHYLSAVPDSIFSALGKVLSLSTQETEILGEKKLQLMAVVDVPDAVAAMQKQGKKAFASIEPRQNFLNKGISYLTGLAFTDQPASVGTESMKFSTLNTPDVYSFDTELEIQWETAAAEPSAGDSLFSKVKALLTGKSKNDESRFADIGQAVEAVAISQKELLDKFTAASSELAAANKMICELKVQAEKDRTEFAAFKEQVDKTPDGTTQRPAASGGNDGIKTDC